jgi:hypothetical protein
MHPESTYVALVHHPVYDRNHEVVATALTNLDLHDIARSVRTYGLGGYFIVHPVAAQRALAERIARHWTSEEGAEKNDFRRMAIERIQVVPSLDDARARLGKPLTVATCARPAPEAISYSQLREKAEGPVLLVFGTGWGLTDELLASCDRRLRPLQPASDYNHLSVRSACAIVLDRLYGDRED